MVSTSNTIIPNFHTCSNTDVNTKLSQHQSSVPWRAYHLLPEVSGHRAELVGDRNQRTIFPPGISNGDLPQGRSTWGYQWDRGYEQDTNKRTDRTMEVIQRLDLCRRLARIQRSNLLSLSGSWDGRSTSSPHESTGYMPAHTFQCYSETS